ncbi:MAG: tRNA lysidine(34) synthetase [Bacilli bacterium]|jgi:tRNA(Ile)-lysidine synthase TilS/MesJ
MAMSTILGCLKQADSDYGLIENGDRLAVGISGGKDSMCLVEALRLYKFFSKKNYEIVPIHINMGFPRLSWESITAFLKERELPLYIEDSSPLIYEVLKLKIDKNGRLSCSICGKMRKAAICKAAHKYQCNKIAFAHHADDAIETLVLNAIHGGRLATFKPKMELSREKVVFIRPLLYAREKEIKRTIKSSQIPFVESTCPNSGQTERQSIKELLITFYHRFPEARNNFLTMLSNQEQLELWVKENDKKR